MTRFQSHLLLCAQNSLLKGRREKMIPSRLPRPTQTFLPLIVVVQCMQPSHPHFTFISFVKKQVPTTLSPLNFKPNPPLHTLPTHIFHLSFFSPYLSPPLFSPPTQPTTLVHRVPFPLPSSPRVQGHKTQKTTLSPPTIAPVFLLLPPFIFFGSFF